jgi:hypothetical protein
MLLVSLRLRVIGIKVLLSGKHSVDFLYLLLAVTAFMPSQSGSTMGAVNLISDGHTDFTDLTSFASTWLNDGCSYTYCDGADIDQNGKVDLQDFALLAKYWLTTYYSGQVLLLNPSFEFDLSGNPSTVARSFSQVLGWTGSTTTMNYLQVMPGGSDGRMFAFFKRNGQYIYQVLNRPIAAGENYLLTFDATDLYQAWGGGIMEFCYQDLTQSPDPISIPGASLDINDVTGDLMWFDWSDHFMLTWRAQAGQSYIGKKLVIRHRSPVGVSGQDGIYGIDNLQLSIIRDPCIPVSNLYVATDGNDITGDGSEAKPFATINQAKQTVRTFIRQGLAQDVHVYIREGTYYLNDTLVFDKRDSAPDGHNVFYEAYPGESPVISGGYKISGTWHNAGGDLWTIQLPPGTWFRQLWCGDDRCQRSRWPNPVANPAINSMLFIKSASPDCKTIALPQTIPGSDAGFVNSDTEAVMYHRFASSRAKIVGKSGSSFTTDTVLGLPGDVNDANNFCSPTTENRVHLEHNLAFIDEATEWYLSRSTGLLTYQAPFGINPNSCTFTVAKLEKLVIINGDVATAVQGIIFRGLSFKHTSWEPNDLDYTGNMLHVYMHDYPADSGSTYFYVVPPAIAMIYADNCCLQQCRISNLAGTGVGLGKGCNNNQIVDCEFYDISGNGILCGWRGNMDTGKLLNGSGGQFQLAGDWYIPADIPHSNIISNNFVHKFDQEWFGHSGISDCFSKYSQVVNNTVADGSYSGITAGFHWDDYVYSQQGTVIRNNHIYNVMNLLNDGAGIYTCGNFLGGLFTGNLVHDVNIGTRANAGWMNGGIYHDQGTSNANDVNNITYNIAGSDLCNNDVYGDHINLTFGTNYWGYVPSLWDSTVSAIAAAAGVQPVAPTLSIAFDSNGSNIIVTGSAGKAWAQLGYARIQEDNYDVTAELTVKENGFIYGVIPLSLVGTNTVTIQATVSTAEGKLSSPGVSNTLSISPFSPPQPVYLVAWFRADGSVTKDASGNVSGWQDASGNNNNAAPPAVKPLWVAGQVNGLPVVRFANASGTSATLLQTAAGALPAGSNLSVFVVAKHRSATAGSSLLGASDGGYGASNQWFILDTISDSGLVKNRVHLNYNASISGTVYDTPTDTSFHVQSMVWNGDTVGYTNSTLFYNIDDVNTLSNIGNMWYLNPIAPIDIGGYDHLGGYYSSDVDIAEILIYKAALSSVDQASITNYLKAKYRLPVITQPTQLPQSASLVAWFKADSGVTKDASNNVSGWNDASSAGHNATATVLKPQWIDAQINGLPIIRFNDNAGVTANANLLQTIPGVVGDVTQLTVFVVGRHRKAVSGSTLVGASDGYYSGASKWFILDTLTDGGIIKNRAALNSDSTYKAAVLNGSVDTNFHVKSMVWTGGLDQYNDNLTRLSFCVDNTEQWVNAGGVWTLSLSDQLDIGGYDHGGTYYCSDVDIAEIIVYNTALSAADRQSVHDYLDGKYALNN